MESHTDFLLNPCQIAFSFYHFGYKLEVTWEEVSLKAERSGGSFANILMSKVEKIRI